MSELSRIHEALQVSYDPRTSADTRQAALQYLDSLKSQTGAPENGFDLASDRGQSSSARHFGLSLLESTIRYHWDEQSEDQARILQEWIIRLAVDITSEDPSFIRNKIAFLLAEIAKREWGGSWMSLDELLSQLWETTDGQKAMVHRLLVLDVLETLSEDICIREDAVAGLRQETLGSALNEIVIPEDVYKRHRESRETTQTVRYTTEGWLARMCSFLSSCVDGAANGHEDMMLCARRTLEAIKPTSTWVSLQAVLDVGLVPTIFASLPQSTNIVQRASVEVLYAVLSRQYNQHFDAEWRAIVGSALRQDHIEILKHVYMSAETSADDIDDDKYTLQKKIAEVLSVLGDAAALHKNLFGNEATVQAFFELLYAAFSSASLMVSIPVLHSFTRIIQAKRPVYADVMTSMMASLLGTCSSRLVRYEAFPQDTDNPTVLFLNDDFETLPEQHAFLGNYRRYCVMIIENIAKTRTQEALQHILDQTAYMLSNVPEVTPAQYRKDSPDILQLDAQTSVVKSALIGYTAWLARNKQQLPTVPLDDQVENDKKIILVNLGAWCQRVMAIHNQHPDVARTAVQLLIEVISRVGNPQTELVAAIISYVLDLAVLADKTHEDHWEAVKNFQAAKVADAQRLAITFPNHLFQVYGQLEEHVGRILSSPDIDQRNVWGLRAVLVSIAHRTSEIDEETRVERLRSALHPLQQAWQDPSLTEALSSFSGFCSLVGLQNLLQYLQVTGFSSSSDWARKQLDSDGRSLQAGISDGLERLPLRMVNSMLAACTEKLNVGGSSERVARAAWAPLMQAILPNLLSLVKNATAFARPDHWAGLPDELQSVMRRMLVDRFWQAGISNESRADFTARISSSMHTYEGLASAVRGAPRHVRDSCYHIVHRLTKFDEDFYGLSGLPGPLAEALFADAACLSPHHLQRLVSLADTLISRCPPQYREHFVPPILKLSISQFDVRIQAEWHSIETARLQSTDPDKLSEEMQAESVIRTTTWSVVVFVASLLEEKDDLQPVRQHRRNKQSHESNGHSYPNLRALALGDPSILEPMILFATHCLSTRDSRCVTTICRALQSIIHVFYSDTPPSPQVREFISTEVLKAAITSLNEPYFVDVQKDLASLIACMIKFYAAKTTTLRDVMLGLPDMNAEKIDRAFRKINESSNGRQQRAVVLDLLEGVRGVSIHEAGRIGVPKAKAKSKMMQQYMEVEKGPEIVRGGSPGLDGLAGMFGDGEG